MNSKVTMYCFLLFIFIACTNREEPVSNFNSDAAPVKKVAVDTGFFARLSDSAMTLINDQVVYDPSYIDIPYPNGDVPSSKGVCSDVIIRAYRKLGIDLQQQVYEDMRHNFDKYPHTWKLSAPDNNIDHRRVPNLMKLFERNKASSPITNNAYDYTPGDIVCWDLGNGLTHIGLVVNVRSDDNKRHLIVHNIGGGQVLADCLFNYKIIGHYRYKGYRVV